MILGRDLTRGTIGRVPGGIFSTLLFRRLCVSRSANARDSLASRSSRPSLSRGRAGWKMRRHCTLHAWSDLFLSVPIMKRSGGAVTVGQKQCTVFTVSKKHRKCSSKRAGDYAQLLPSYRPSPDEAIAIRSRCGPTPSNCFMTWDASTSTSNSCRQTPACASSQSTLHFNTSTPTTPRPFVAFGSLI